MSDDYKYISSEEYIQMDQDNEGKCIKCGGIQKIEPDAEDSYCEVCGMYTVQGSIWFLLNDYIL